MTKNSAATGTGSAKAKAGKAEWIDPDDAPEWTDAMFEIAEHCINGKVIRPATGYLAKDGVRLGRPPERGVSKEQVTLRLDPDVIERFRADGPGWQGRINGVLRKAMGL
jgi:uncharacterized protein (DUF4415 family)